MGQEDVPSEFRSLFFITHITHLVCDVLHPCLCAFHARCYLCELRAYNGLGGKRFSQDFSFGYPPVEEVSLKIGHAILGKTNLRHSSRTRRCVRALAVHITHRSWLKLLHTCEFIHSGLNMKDIPQNDKHSTAFLSQSV